ncbi:hypothetical protein BKA67DRAFT_559405 [Truncatella angustata]|uniref:rRNA biogenesis protein RRP36 n=1 Tax=Truncatella angustata TaxID=152316 RepID=A0A9P8UMM7_9PEZI|nr:uncharacterized protein BKA67DRAFT_559405 [Truncatella angustata]KAH6655066.1 hypothetical protein BKA67DRAFT_559405 [Truncatella angustata]KAH8195411.1 hypothetical protein TruAng_010418 [Truncatella angustata]
MMERSKSAKRKLPSAGLQRRVRARKNEPEPDFEQDHDSQSSVEESDGEDVSQLGSEGSEEEDDDEEEEDEEEPANPGLAATQISFGALAKAQASLPSARKKHQKGTSQDGSGDEDDDSGPEEVDRNGNTKLKPIAGRSSKHAPAEMTSKRQVTRKRQVVDTNTIHSRDPRFGPPLGGIDARTNDEALRKNYSFLNDYRDTEMKELRAKIKKTKDPFEKQRLERELLIMQSKKQTQERKDAASRVIEEHRQKEKELVKQGKTPFYLKKSEQKKRVLVERFQGMKKRQVDKAIVRRRKKETAKEKKELPMERRAR